MLTIKVTIVPIVVCICRYDLPHGINKVLREEASREIFRENLEGKFISGL